jgi:putative addiction module component (TIGR02574 family)
MTMGVTLTEIRRMSVPERLELIGEIWGTLVEEKAEAPLTEAHAGEIDRRLEAYRRDPSLGASWEEFSQGLEAEGL